MKHEGMVEMATETESMAGGSGSVPRAGEQDAALLSMLPATAGCMDDDAPVSRYGFRIGGLALLVPEGIETDVLDNPRVFPLPRAPHWLAGILNQRGNVVPVFDILKLLELQARPSKARQILLMGHAAQAVAVYIDSLPQPLTTTDRIENPADLPAILRPFAEPAFSDQGTDWFEFNHTEFFQYLSAGAQDEVESRD